MESEKFGNDRFPHYVVFKINIRFIKLKRFYTLNNRLWKDDCNTYRDLM